MGQTADKAYLIIMDIFLNELSIQTADNREIAKTWIDDMIDVVKEANNVGFGDFKTTRDIFHRLLAPEYNISAWLGDNQVNKERRNFLQARLFRTPYIEDMIEDVADDGIQEIKYSNRPSLGLGAASLFDSLSISFDNHEDWDRNEVPINKHSLDEDGNLITENIAVKHACKTRHISEHRQWIEDKRKLTFLCGKDIWKRKKDIFPHLSFCQKVEKQIIGMNKNNPRFNQIINKLDELEKYCLTWQSGYFDITQFNKLTLESQNRKQTLNHKLTILCPDNKERFFSLHFRYTPGAGRLHLCPDNNTRTVYIGYIGNKIM
jgi:hypothetical protein